MLTLLIVLAFVLSCGTVSSSPNIKDATVMICAFMMNEEVYIDEWLYYQKYLGFDMVYIYDNGEVPSPYMAGLYKKFGDFVKIKHFPFGNNTPTQKLAYQDCLRTFRHNNTWAAVIDTDEFIVLKQHETIKDLLHDLAPEGGAVVLNWAMMGNSGIKKHEEGPVVARFIHTCKDLQTNHRKTISYLGHTTELNVHHSVLKRGYPKVDPMRRNVCCDHIPGFLSNTKGHRDVAYVNHYYTKSLQEYVLRKRRSHTTELNRVTPSYISLAKIFEGVNSYCRVQDTWARDFYLRHNLGRAYTALIGGTSAMNVTTPALQGVRFKI